MRIQLRPWVPSRVETGGEARVKSVDETRAEVSTKTATAILVSGSVRRGSASASTIARNARVFKTNAVVRRVLRHSNTSHARGRQRNNNTQARSKVMTPSSKTCWRRATRPSRFSAFFQTKSSPSEAQQHPGEPAIAKYLERPL